MLIAFTCAGCGGRLEIEASAAGLEISCPHCQATAIVPDVCIGPGVTVGGFLIEALLGRGAMGEVYRARQLSMDRDVALKILPPQFAIRKELVERFLQEVRLMARLDHAHIVPAYEAGEDGGVYFMAMAYVKGQSLDKRLKQGVMEERESLALARKLASALSYAWDEFRLLHRDIKPANIILDTQGNPRLLDLGLSKSLQDTEALTSCPMMLGTPSYMSPEQAQGQVQLDFRTDMYSLGATLYHMLTGKRPFEATSLVDTIRRLVTEPLPDPRGLNPAISEACVNLLEVMLAKEAANRFPSWDDFIADLDRVLENAPPSRPPLAPGASVLQRADAASPAKARKKQIVLTGTQAEKLHEMGRTRAKARASPARSLGALALLAAGAAALWWWRVTPPDEETGQEPVVTVLSTGAVVNAPVTLRELDQGPALETADARDTSKPHAWGASAATATTSRSKGTWRRDALDIMQRHELHVMGPGTTNPWVGQVSFSPDGDILATASSDGRIGLWDVVSGRIRKSIAAASSNLEDIAFSPDGQVICSASQDGTLRLWSVETGAQIAELLGRGSAMSAARFSPDGRVLAAVGADAVIRLWDVGTGERTVDLSGHMGQVWSLDFSPNGGFLASTGGDGTVRLWDLAAGKQMAMRRAAEAWNWCVAFSPDGSTLAVGSTDARIRLLDVVSGAEMARFAGHERPVRRLAFARGGTALASAGTDQTVRLWDTATRQAIATLFGFSGWVNAVTLSRNGTVLAAAGEGDVALVWDLAWAGPSSAPVAASPTTGLATLRAWSEKPDKTNPNPWNSHLSGYFGMSIAGTFNQWWEGAFNMQLAEDYQWHSVVTLKAETNLAFKFVANGTWDDNWGVSEQPALTLPLSPDAQVEKWDGASKGWSNVVVAAVAGGTYRFSFNEETLNFALEALPALDVDGNGVHDAVESFWESKREADPRKPAADKGMSANELLSAMVDDLLRQDFEAARSHLAEAKSAPISGTDLQRFLQMEGSLDVLAGMPALILESFKQDVGRDIALDLHSGPATLKVVRVTPAAVEAVRTVRIEGRAAGETRQSIRVSDLSPREKFRRLGKQESPELDLMRGLLACESKAFDAAGKYFARSNTPLGQALTRRLDASR